jgi:hypothetical protein
VTDLSPAAQAVITASNCAGSRIVQLHIAAALRATADQVLAVQWQGRIEPDAAHSLGINWTRDALHSIAAELEGQ